MTFVLVLEQFTKGFSLILVLSFVITLRLDGGGLKYGRHVMFSPLQNFIRLKLSLKDLPHLCKAFYFMF